MNKVKIRFALAFILPMLIAVAWYIAMRFYPIENVVLYTSDLSQQYRAFLSYYQDWLHGKVSMQYSWDLFSGSNMLGNFAYYTGSIFNVVLFFFPKRFLYEAICLILVLKIACTGGAMYAYIEHTMEKRKELALIFSTSFAFCGMLVGYFFNIIWLDAFIYLPLIVLGLKRMMETKKMSKLFIISLTLLLIANFYMAYMVGGVVFLLFLGQLFNKDNEKNQRWKDIGRFFGMTVTSLGLSAVVIVPTMLQLQLASTSGVSFRNVWFNPIDALGKLFNGVYYQASYIDTGGAIAPHLYSGLFTLLLIIPFFMLKTIKIQQKITYGSILSFLFISLLWEPLGLAWQGFNYPTGYPFRFAFLVSFILIDLASQALNKLELSSRIYIWWGLVGISILWLLLSVAIPSIGIGIWWWNQILFVIISALLYLYLEGKFPLFFETLLIIVCVIDVGSSSILATKQMEQVNKFNTYEARSYSANQDTALEEGLKQIQSKNQTTLNRAKSNYNSFLDDNLFYGFSSVGGFSSLKSGVYGTMMHNLGYEATRVSVRTGSGTQLTNDLFNVTTNITANYRLDKTSSETKSYQKGDLSIYEQPYKVSTGLVVDSLKIDKHFNSDAQEKIVELFNGDPKSIIENVAVTDVEESGVIKEGRNYLQTGSAAKLTYSLPKTAEDEDLYVYFGSPYDVKGITYSLSMRRGIPLQNGWHFVEKGANSLTIDWSEKQAFPEYAIKFMKINTSEWKQLMQKNDGLGLQIEKIGTKSFSGVVPANHSSTKSLLLTIPYDKGWTYKINGRVVKSKQVFDNLTSLNLPETLEKIKIDGYYTSPGLRIGQGITILTVIFLLGYSFILKKKNNH